MGKQPGLQAPAQCSAVEPGFWAPTGSAVPEACPASGFWCPGAALDPLYNGSKPIIADTGFRTRTRSVEVKEVRTELTLDQNLDDVFVPSLKAALATLYGVPASQLSLDLSPGSVVVAVRITVEGTDNTEAIAASILAADAAAVTAALGITALGVMPPTVTSRNITRMEQAHCPQGHWW